MKGSTRYYRDPEFKAQVDEQFALATAATRKGVWITYAIHDPTVPDHIEGRPEGLIRYVGQTKNFGKRVRKRMSTAGKAVRRPTDNIDGLLWEVMARGPAPRWSVLEEAGSAIDSLVSETNWTIKLRAKGYPLVNQWTEHKLGTLEIDRYQVGGLAMGGFSIWHWLIVAMVIAWAIAVGKILKRLGFSPAWGILALFPLINFIGIWVVALIDWPIEARGGSVHDRFS